MKKPLKIASVLLLLTLFTIGLSLQEDFYKSKLDDYWRQINRTMCEVVITMDGKLVYEKTIGFSAIKEKNRNNNLINSSMASILVFEIISDLKIRVFIIKDNDEFINNNRDLFAVKMPEDSKPKKELEKPLTLPLLYIMR